jgi:hypothetical protein
MAKKKKGGKKGGKKKGGKKGGKGGASEEDIAAAHLALLARFRQRFLAIAGAEASPVALTRAIAGPPPDADEDPGWYDARAILQMADIPLGPAGTRAICWAILGTPSNNNNRHGKLPPISKKKGNKTAKPVTAAGGGPVPPKNNAYTHYGKISLIGCNTKDHGALALAELLRAGPTVGVEIATLELVNCNITPAGADFLSQSLAFGGNITLHTLNLAYNKGLGNNGLQDLCVGLRGNETLKTLSLRCCALEGAKMGACVALLLSSAQSTLKSIDLSANALGPVGLSIVCRALKRNVRCESLNLAENGIDADFEPSAGGGYDIFMRSMNHLRLALQWNRTLVRLDLSFNSISEDGAKQLLPALGPDSAARNKTLKYFMLSTLISGETFKKLGRQGKVPGVGGKGKKGKKKKGKGKKKKK